MTPIQLAWTGDVVNIFIHDQDQKWRRTWLILEQRVPIILDYNLETYSFILSGILDVQESYEADHCLTLVTTSNTISIYFQTDGQMSRWRNIFLIVVDLPAILYDSDFVANSSSVSINSTMPLEEINAHISDFREWLASGNVSIIQSIDEHYTYCRSTDLDDFVLRSNDHIEKENQEHGDAVAFDTLFVPGSSRQEVAVNKVSRSTRKRAYTEGSNTNQSFVSQSKASRWNRIFSPVKSLRREKSDDQLSRPNTNTTSPSPAAYHSNGYPKSPAGVRSWLRGSLRYHSPNTSQDARAEAEIEKEQSKRSRSGSESSEKRPIRINPFNRLKVSARTFPSKLKLSSSRTPLYESSATSKRVSWQILDPLKSPSFDSLGLLDSPINKTGQNNPPRSPLEPPIPPFANHTDTTPKTVTKSSSLEAMTNHYYANHKPMLLRPRIHMPGRDFHYRPSLRNRSRGRSDASNPPPLSPDNSGLGSSRPSSPDSFMSFDKDAFVNSYSFSTEMYKPSTEDLMSRRRSRGPSLSVIVVPPDIQSPILDDAEPMSRRRSRGPSLSKVVAPPDIEAISLESNSQKGKSRKARHRYAISNVSQLRPSSFDFLNLEDTPPDHSPLQNTEDGILQFNQTEEQTLDFPTPTNAKFSRISTVQGIHNERLTGEGSNINSRTFGRNQSLPLMNTTSKLASDQRLDKIQKDGLKKPRDLTGQVSKCTTYATDHGGFADVYVGDWCKEPGVITKVAIKVLRPKFLDDPEADNKVRRRLQRELRVWQHLRHRHVLELCGICADFGPYEAMVSPWLAKGNISRYLKKRTPTANTWLRLKLLCEAAEGLQYLHSISPPVIHGDLTGSNILVDDNEEACICDFGLSNVIEVASGLSITNTSSFAGNVRWMAPELFVHTDAYGNPSRVSVRTDVYSFGCVALEVLTGRIPFYHIKNDAQVVIEVSRGTRLHNPSGGDDMRATDEQWEYIQSCCADDPDARPTMFDVLERFRCFRDLEVAGQPISEDFIPIRVHI